MTVKKVVFVAILCAFVAAPVLADFSGHGAGYDGGTASLSRYDGYYAGQGGEFTIEGAGLLLSNSAYSSSTSAVPGSDLGSFQTFCVETHEKAYDGSRIWVSEENIDGGMPGSHAYYGGVYKTGDDLDPMTAFLYTQFATEVLETMSLGGYNYDYTPGSGRENSAQQLQYAIWAIEEGIDLTMIPNTTVAQAWIDAAPAAMAAAGWADTDIGNVRVLQMYKWVNWYGCCEWYCLKQDMLYLTPAPGAVLLGVIGLVVVGLKLRKYA